MYIYIISILTIVQAQKISARKFTYTLYRYVVFIISVQRNHVLPNFAFETTCRRGGGHSIKWWSVTRIRCLATNAPRRPFATALKLVNG